MSFKCGYDETKMMPAPCPVVQCPARIPDSVKDAHETRCLHAALNYKEEINAADIAMVFGMPLPKVKQLTAAGVTAIRQGVMLHKLLTPLRVDAGRAAYSCRGCGTKMTSYVKFTPGCSACNNLVLAYNFVIQRPPFSTAVLNFDFGLFCALLIGHDDAVSYIKRLEPGEYKNGIASYFNMGGMDINQIRSLASAIVVNK